MDNPTAVAHVEQTVTPWVQARYKGEGWLLYVDNIYAQIDEYKPHEACMVTSSPPAGGGRRTGSGSLVQILSTALALAQANGLETDGFKDSDFGGTDFSPDGCSKIVYNINGCGLMQWTVTFVLVVCAVMFGYWLGKKNRHVEK